MSRIKGSGQKGPRLDPAHRAKAPRRKNKTRPNFAIVALRRLIPAQLNDKIYKEVHSSDPGMTELAESISSDGLRERIRVTRDHVVLSGHRRRVACEMAGLRKVPVEFVDILSTDSDFPRLLVTFNTGQRTKTAGERVREQLILNSPDPDAAYENLINERVEASRVKAAPLFLGEAKTRAAISPAKEEFLAAVRRVIDYLQNYHPLSDRRIHYSLLNDPPLIHISKPHSRYRNDVRSYKALTDLLTRARLAGLIPFEVIGDDTRPVTIWNVHPNVSPFVSKEIKDFLGGYSRDLMQDQPNHVEIVAEKLTVQGTARPVAMEFRLPLTVGRGYSSLPPRKEMFERFRRSGKEKLVILFLADCDPEGMDIPVSFAKSMRDDFGVKSVHPVRVGLNIEQVRRLKLPENTAAKASSSRFEKFQAKFGSAAYELEAVAPALLQQWLREEVLKVIDTKLFNAQILAERQDAATLATFRAAAGEYLQSLKTDE